MTHRTIRQLIAKPDVETLPPHATVREAADRMARSRIGAVLIVDDDGTLRGIFSERDAVTRVMADGRDSRETTLESVMTDRVLTVHPEDDINQALRLMRDVGFRHLPVVEDGALIGLISVRDLLHAAEFAGIPRAVGVQADSEADRPAT
jgi:CBS domain-containing protein